MFTGRTGTTITPGSTPKTAKAGYIDGKKIQGIVEAPDGFYYDLGEASFTIKVDTEYNQFLASVGADTDPRTPAADAPAAPAAQAAPAPAPTSTHATLTVHHSVLSELHQLLRELEAGVVADAITLRNQARKLLAHFSL